MSWLVYSQFRSPEQRTAAEMRGSSLAPVTTVASSSEAISQRFSTVDYNAEREQARLMAERSVSLQSYYRAIATKPYTRSGLENGSIAAYSPSYAETYQEPAAVPADYAAYTQPIVYAQPTQLVVYTEPIQTVGFSNSRRFGNRGRSIPRACPPQVITPRLNTLSAGPSGNRLLSSGPSRNVLSRATAIAPACPPTARDSGLGGIVRPAHHR